MCDTCTSVAEGLFVARQGAGLELEACSRSCTTTLPTRGGPATLVGSGATLCGVATARVAQSRMVPDAAVVAWGLRCWLQSRFALPQRPGRRRSHAIRCASFSVSAAGGHGGTDGV